MRMHPVVARGVLVLAAGSSAAADQAPTSHAQVEQSVVAAQAPGQLRVGEEPGYPGTRPATTGKSIWRKAKSIASATQSRATTPSVK